HPSAVIQGAVGRKRNLPATEGVAIQRFQTPADHARGGPPGSREAGQAAALHSSQQTQEPGSREQQHPRSWLLHVSFRQSPAISALTFLVAACAYVCTIGHTCNQSHFDPSRPLPPLSCPPR